MLGTISHGPTRARADVWNPGNWIVPWPTLLGYLPSPTLKFSLLLLGYLTTAPSFWEQGFPYPSFDDLLNFLTAGLITPAFADLVREAWQTEVHGSPLYIVVCKLKLIKAKLKVFNKAYFSNIATRVSTARQVLFDIQNQLEESPSCPNLWHLERATIQDLVNLSKAEESIFRQKSRIQWLAEGDQNTGFFH